eukprot:m.66797 g.66797  ORF g.66797 m.66797 type:complete len:469 (-) comp23725_c1_seq2:84-1490(-)
MEKIPLLDKNTTPVSWGIVFQRHYCLFISCCLAAIQGGIWNTWGPIAPAVQEEYGWSGGDIALLANWGPISYLIAFLPSAYVLQYGGLRRTVVFTNFCLVIASGIRCIPVYGEAWTVLVHMGQFINGLCGVIAMSVGPVVSVTFYPTEQRPLATSIIAVSNYLGVAATFVLGPYLVPEQPDKNSTHINSTNFEYDTVSNSTHHSATETQVRRYLYWQTGIMVVVFLASVLYFPNRPSNAPSRSAASNRTSFWKGFADLLKSSDFWIVALSYGIMCGTYSGWGAFLAPNLGNFLDADEAETVSGYLGFYATLAGAVGGVAMGLCTTSLGGRMKRLLLGLCFLATLSYTWFALACLGDFPDSDKRWTWYLSCIFGGFVLNGSIPLFYEMAVENMYPIAEGSVTALLTTFNNVGCLIYLFAPMIPGIGNAWANWTLAGTCLLAFCLLLPFQEKKSRTAFDRQNSLSSNPVN